jgi:predicted RNase H-like nuclease (RuvC/YqgF family)
MSRTVNYTCYRCGEIIRSRYDDESEENEDANVPIEKCKKIEACFARLQIRVAKLENYIQAVHKESYDKYEHETWVKGLESTMNMLKRQEKREMENKINGYNRRWRTCHCIVAD